MGAAQTLDIDLASDDPGALNELYVSYGTMPSRAQYDYRYQTPGADQEITIPATQAGTYYVLAYGGSVAAGGEGYTLTASVVPFAVTAVSPAQVGAGQATIEIDGSMFAGSTTFQLVGPSGQSVNAQQVYLQDSSTAYVTFDLSGAALGDYNVKATQSTGAATALPQGLAVVAAVPASIQFYVSSPSSILAFGQGEATVNYVNQGNVDATAPLVELTATNALLQLSDQDSFVNDWVQFLATSATGPEGLLRPGESGAVNIPFEATGARET